MERHEREIKLVVIKDPVYDGMYAVARRGEIAAQDAILFDGLRLESAKKLAHDIAQSFMESSEYTTDPVVVYNYEVEVD